MRQVVENPVYMTIEDMKTKYQGKWIYIAKCNMADGYELIGGTPVVVADSPFEGDVSFYDQFRGKGLSPFCERNFNRKEQFFFPAYPPDEEEVFEWTSN